VGILTFTFDGLRNSVRRLRALECYSFLIISSLITYIAIVYCNDLFLISDGMLRVVNLIEMFSKILNWSVLLICLASNKRRIRKLVNDGLKIEHDFRHHYYLKPWNLYLIMVICFKDIIYLIGNTYFNVSISKNEKTFFFCYRVVSGVFLFISAGFVENVKIICHFHVSHLLGILNKTLSRKRCNINVETIREISKMYDRLLSFAEDTSKLLEYRTTMVLVCCLIVTSAEV
jgi:hypothetical protein